MRAQNAHPPAPPTPGFSTENDDSIPCSYATREAETRRGAEQILEAVGCINLRNVSEIRMVSLDTNVPTRTPTPGPALHGGNGGIDDRQMSVGDELAGDDETTSTIFDKAYSKARKTFELVTRSGDIHKFEVSIHLLVIYVSLSITLLALVARLPTAWRVSNKIDCESLVF